MVEEDESCEILTSEEDMVAACVTHRGLGYWHQTCAISSQLNSNMNDKRSPEVPALVEWLCTVGGCWENKSLSFGTWLVAGCTFACEWLYTHESMAVLTGLQGFKNKNWKT